MKENKNTGLDLSVMRPFLEGILKNMEGGVVTIDLDKRIMSFNKAAEWITGYCLEDVLGKPCYEILKGNICDTICPFDKVIKKSTPVNITQSVVKSKEGIDVVTSRSVFPLKDIHGEKRGVVVIFRDITELQNLRQQLLQSEKLAVMGQLAAGVAHEINNPINGIITYIHLLLKKLDANEVDPEVWKRNLKLVERETVRIGRLVKNLLNFSRKTEPDLGPVSPVKLVEQSLSLLDDQFLLKNIKIHKKYDSNIPNILGDFNQLQQVVMNLIMNAVQAVDNKGEISISLTTKGASGSECFVYLDIQDNGAGIPEDALAKIFDPFYTTKTGDGGGVGLGLSIARQIVKAHHGRITINSQVNEGTSVTIRLPTP